MTNSTFPVIHGLEHPLVVRFLYENPVTTHTVRGVVSESLLHRHAGVNSVIKKKQKPLQVQMLSTLWDFFLWPATLLQSAWSCSLVGVFKSLIQISSLFSSLCCLWHSMLLFFFHQLLQNACLRATMSEAVIHHWVVCGEGGKILPLALPSYIHPDPTSLKTTPWASNENRPLHWLPANAKICRP